MGNPAVPNYIRLPYPADSDAKVRRAAELIEYEAAIKALDMIKNELLGNAERANEIAHLWGENTTMNDAKGDLNSMKYTLASYWKGPAFNAFNAYTIDAVGIMDKDLAVMGTMATTLGSTVSTVFDTYAKAITFIGNCAAALANLGAALTIAFATAEVPGVNVLTSAAVLNKVSDTLAAFVKEVVTLIAGATTQIGQYKSQGISFANQATQFQHPEPLPDAATHTSQWQVNPNR